MAEPVLVDSAVFERYQSMKQELQSLGDKLGELEMDADEHRLVLAALAPLEPKRKCWRRIGGVLVETDIGNTIPTLQSTLQGVSAARVFLLRHVDRENNHQPERRLETKG